MEVQVEKEVGDFTNILSLSLPHSNLGLTEREGCLPRAGSAVRAQREEGKGAPKGLEIDFKEVE